MISLAYAALWFFIFSLPWENVLVIPGVGIISKLMGMVALSLALLAAVMSGRVRRWHVLHVAAVVFVIWTGVGVMVNHTQGVPKKFYTFIELFLVLWMIWELARSERRVLGLLTAYVFGAYVGALDTLLEFRQQAKILSRFSATDFDGNDLAMTLALALPMAWYLGMKHRRPLLRWACRAYLPLGLVAIGLTASRGGMLASMVALLIVPLSMTRLTPGRLVTAIAVLGISGALAVAYVPEKIVERLSTTGEQVQELKFGGRFKLWVGGVNAFVQRPVIGYGTASYKQAITPWLGSLSQVAHNSYLSVLVEEGSVGFVLYWMMFLAVFLAVLNLPPPDRRFALILFATLALAMFPLTWEDRKPVWFILAALLGLSQASVEEARGAVPAPQPRRAAPLARQPLTARVVAASGARRFDRDAPA
jgi:O-antigen ligase